MRKRLSKKESWFKENNLTAQDEIYVGIDVHKDRYHVAIWHNGRIGCLYSTSSDNNKLFQDLRRIRNSLKNVVYEAGPTGYGLVRLLRSADIPSEIIATSKTPRMADSAAKTDRLDCQQLAEYAAKGLLTFVAIPTEQQEADRQVVRLRDQLISKRKRVMQQIKGFLLQHSIVWPGGGWSKVVLCNLRKMDIGSELRFTLDKYLDEYEFLSRKIAQTNSRLRRIFSSKRHSAAIEIFKSHPGVGNIVAWEFRAEMFDITRFSQPKQISKYIGLCPRISQSGKTCRQGPITKTGRRQLRAILIQAAWAWYRKDPHARQIYNRLLHNTGNGKKAIVGLAKRIAIHLWRMLCDGCLYDVGAVKA
ncbi:MAG: IS110 family transposase [Clostridia bacterium]|nr:IS110 family transposase [Clostridia bacterium]